MKAKIRFLLSIGMIPLVIVAISACASAQATPVPVAAAVIEDDVFGLLDKGESERARMLFLGKADIDGTDSKGRTALHIAALRKDSDLMVFLLQRGAKLEAREAEGKTPFQISVELSHQAGIKALAEAGANLFAVDQPTSDTVRMLLMNSALLNAAVTKANVDSRDSKGRTLLHRAAESANAAAVSLLISKAATVNAEDNDSQTPLDYAFERPDSYEHIVVAESIILAGGRTKRDQVGYCIPAIRSSSFDIRFDDGMAPLHFAARAGHTGIIKYLISKKARVDAKNSSGAPPLHEAFRMGKIDAARLLIQAGADVNARDAKGNTAMHLVIPLSARKDGMELLLANRADPNVKDDHGDSPLHIAVGTNLGADIAQRLISSGANPNIRNSEGQTPLHVAVNRERSAYVAALLANRADALAADLKGKTPFDLALSKNRDTIDALITRETALTTDKEGNTLLHLAVLRSAGIDTVGLIIERKAIVNARNMNGDTPLHLAVSMNRRDAGELLIAKGADIFAVNAEGRTPLHLAVNASHGDSGWMLNSATIATKDGLGNGLLHYAALWGLDRLIPILVQAGAKPDDQNATGETPLFSAIRADSPESIAALLASGASTSARDALGNTALHAAVRWNAKQSTQALIKGGAAVDGRNSNGKTPLHDAVRLGMGESEKARIEAGADLEAKDISGNTPLMDAVQNGLSAAAERLLEYGASPTVRNNSGDTPLHSSIASSRLELSSLLLGRGASIFAKNAKGETPLALAFGLGSEAASALLTKDRINSSDDEGRTPLHIAVSGGAPIAIVSQIIALGAAVSEPDAKGSTPLHRSLNAKQYEVARILVKSGADPFILTGAEETPAEAALRLGQEAVAALFDGAAVSASDMLGNTALHYAAKQQDEAIVERLIKLGADKQAKNISGESPYEIALRWRRNKIEALLKP